MIFLLPQQIICQGRGLVLTTAFELPPVFTEELLDGRGTTGDPAMPKFPFKGFVCGAASGFNALEDFDAFVFVGNMTDENTDFPRHACHLGHTRDAPAEGLLTSHDGGVVFDCVTGIELASTLVVYTTCDSHLPLFVYHIDVAFVAGARCVRNCSQKANFREVTYFFTQPERDIPVINQVVFGPLDFVIPALSLNVTVDEEVLFKFRSVGEQNVKVRGTHLFVNTLPRDFSHGIEDDDVEPFNADSQVECPQAICVGLAVRLGDHIVCPSGILGVTVIPHAGIIDVPLVDATGGGGADDGVHGGVVDDAVAVHSNPSFSHSAWGVCLSMLAKYCVG